MFQLQNLFQTDAAERAHSIFSNLDLDGNGEITEEEFVKGCMEDKDLVDTISGDKPATEENYVDDF